MTEEKVSSLLFGKILVMKLWPCSSFDWSISALLVQWKAFMTQDFWEVMIFLKPRMPGFFLSVTLIKTPFLPLISPFKSLDTHRIQQTPHLQCDQAFGAQSHKNVTSHEVSLAKSWGNDCAFISYFLLSDATTHKVVGACSWQKQHAVIWKS